MPTGGGDSGRRLLALVLATTVLFSTLTGVSPVGLAGAGNQAGNVAVGNQALDPSVVEDDRTVSQLLTFTARNVSDDGRPDTFTVQYPSTVESVGSVDVSVTDADGVPLPVTGPNVSGNEYTFAVSPESNAVARDLSVVIEADVTVADVSADTTDGVTVGLDDSARGSDAAVVDLTVEQAVGIAGRVEASNGSAVSAGRIKMLNESTGAFGIDDLNESGEFSDAVEPNRTYLVEFSQRPAGYPLDGVVDGLVTRSVEVGTADVDLGSERLPDAHRLNITVVDEAGNPVENATVVLSRTDSPPPPGPIVNGTDARGRFVLGGTVGAELNGTVGVSVSPPRDDLRFNSTIVTVDADKDVRIVLKQAVEVSGTVENADGSAVAAGRIETFNESTGVLGTDGLNDSGGFSVTVEPNRTYQTGFTQGPVGYPLDGVVDILPIEALEVGTADVDLGTRTLPAANRLNVTVVDEDGDPVENAVVGVGAVTENGSPSVFDPTAVNFSGTDAQGRFVLGGTPGVEVNGTVVVSVDPPGDEYRPNSTTVEVTQNRSVTVVLERFTTLTGRVVRSDGTGVANLDVEANDFSTDPPTGGSDDTNATGEYAFAVEANRTYDVTFDQAETGYPVDGIPDIGVFGAVEVGTDPIDLGVRTVEGHRLNVTVVDEAGEPVENATVEVTRRFDGAERVIHEQTDAQGRFALGGTVGIELNGTAEVAVDPPGDGREPNTTTVSMSRDRDLRVVFPTVVDVTGSVETADGSPARGLKLEAFDPTVETVNDTAMADETGDFGLFARANRSYGVTYSEERRGYPLNGVPDGGVLAEFGTGNGSVDLGTERLPAAHRLNVTVVDETGTPVADVRVTVTTDVGGTTEFEMFNETNARGQFVFGTTPGVEVNGTVGVTVEPPADDLYPNRTTVEVTRNRSVTVVLEDAATLSGRVVGPDGAPLGGDAVGVFNGSRFVNASLTNETGSFAVLAPTGGTYDALFVDLGPNETAFPRNGVPDLYGLVGTTLRNDTDLGTITVPGASVLDVRVENTAGVPIENATVEVSSRGTRYLQVGLTTDEDGLVRADTRPESGVELAGDVGIRVNLTTADGTFRRATVDRNLTVEENTTVTVTATRVLTVDPDDPGAYDTIRAAVEAAPAGSVVRVRPATYRESVRIGKPLALVGRPGDPTPGPADGAPVLTGAGDAASGIVVDNATNVSVAGFEIRNYSAGDGGAGRGVAIQGKAAGNVTISDSAIHDVGRAGIEIRALESGTRARVRSNVVREAGIGLAIRRPAAGAPVRAAGNRFLDGRVGVAVGANASAADVTVIENSIVDAQVGVTNNGTGVVNATRNWWGASDGPGGGFSGSGTPVRGDVTVQPFYLDAERTELSEPATVRARIDSTTAPVTEGESLDVTATVENTGDVTGTRTVSLSVGGTERDAAEVTLAPGASERIVLSWGTVDGDAGDYTATVATGDDTASTDVVVEAFVPEPDPTTSVSLSATGPSSVPGGENATVTYAIENTGDTALDSVALDVTADTDGVAVATDVPLRVEGVSAGETVRAVVDVRANDTALGEQALTATVTAEAGEDTVTRTATTRFPVTQRIRVESVSFAPGTVAGNRSVSGTVSFRVAKVSSDGATDTLEVSFPPAAGNVSGADVTVTDTDGEEVPVTGIDTDGSTVTVGIDPDGDAALRTLSGTLTVEVATRSVTTNTTAEISLAANDSATGRDDATAPLTIVPRAGVEGIRVGDSDAAPTDPDGDGRYEDVNGDGEVTPGDASVLFNAWFDRDPAVRDNSALFDMNGDGEVVMGDATVLFLDALESS